MVYVIELSEDFEAALTARLAGEQRHFPPVDRAQRVQELCQEALVPWLLALTEQESLTCPG